MTERTEWREAYDNEFIRGLDKDFGKHARTRREFLDYSQGVVSILMQAEYAIPWHQTVVAKVEAGTRAVKLKEAFALADIYGLPLEDLAHGRNLTQLYEINFHPSRWGNKRKAGDAHSGVDQEEA